MSSMPLNEGVQFRYVSVIEDLINLPFFADHEMAERFRHSPEQIPLDALRSRAALYVTGLQLVAEELAGLPTENQDQTASPIDKLPENIGAIRERRAYDISAIRSELMILEPKLETPLVRNFRHALRAERATRESYTSKSKSGSESVPIEVLPPHLIPIRAASNYLQIGMGSLRTIALNRKVGQKLRLPGHQRAEICIDWSTVQEIENIHGRLPSQAPLDYDKLPLSAEDTDPDKVIAAREAQLRLVPLDRLINVPELGGSVDSQPIYQPVRDHEISRSALARLLKGGYHFIDDYCRRSNWQLQFRKNRSGVGQYMTLEQAAEIWAAYHKIPLATETDIPIIRVAQDTGHVKTHIEHYLREDEAPKVMRAQDPPGRVLRHITLDAAVAVSERARPDVLTPYLLPLQVFDAIVDSNYWAMVKFLASRRIEPNAKLRMPNMKTDLVCYSWNILEMLEDRYGCRPDAPFAIAYTKLPQNDQDTNPKRLAYAQAIQKALVPQEWLGLIPDLQATPDWRPKGSSPPLRKIIGMSLSANDIAKLTGAAMADVEATIASLASGGRYLPPKSNTQHGTRAFIYEGEYLRDIIVRLAGYGVDDIAYATGFWPQAVQAVAITHDITTVDGRYPPGSLETFAKLRPPRDYYLFSDVLSEVDMGEAEARDFLNRHYGKIVDGLLDPSGRPNTYVNTHARELLIRQRYPDGKSTSGFVRPAGQWLHRQQIVELTGKPIEDFEKWLQEHLRLSSVVQWRMTTDRVVLPHFDNHFVRPYLYLYLYRK